MTFSPVLRLLSTFFDSEMLFSYKRFICLLFLTSLQIVLVCATLQLVLQSSFSCTEYFFSCSFMFKLCIVTFNYKSLENFHFFFSLILLEAWYCNFSSVYSKHLLFLSYFLFFCFSLTINSLCFPGSSASSFFENFRKLSNSSVFLMQTAMYSFVMDPKLKSNFLRSGCFCCRAAKFA